MVKTHKKKVSNGRRSSSKRSQTPYIKKWLKETERYFEQLSPAEVELLRKFSKGENVDQMEVRRKILYAPTITEPIILWVGSRRPLFDNINVGDEIVSDRIIHASLDKRVAINFSSGTISKLIIHPGAKCLYLMASAFPNEKTVLIPPGSYFSVKSRTPKVTEFVVENLYFGGRK
jgi:hypothetical protein